MPLAASCRRCWATWRSASLIGPHALALARRLRRASRYLAEFGVVFLMFVIGLEFNLPKLQSMRTLVFGLGLSQVALTIAGGGRRQRAARLSLCAWLGRALASSAGRARSRSAARWR